MFGQLQRSRRTRKDNSLILAVGLLALLGLVVIYTISPALNYSNLESPNANYFVYRHLGNLVIGIVAFVVCSRLPLTWWRKVLPLLAAAVVISTILLLIPQTSITAGGATRWVALGPISFQPSEIIKFAVLVYTAFFLANRSDRQLEKPLESLMPVGIMLLICGLLVVVLQRDLSTMIVIAAMAFGMLYYRGLATRYLLWLGAGAAILAILSVALFPHRMSRFTAFTDPSQCDSQSQCYQLDQSLTAIGSGGIFGLGIGRSVQVYGYLPEAENDSVFAIYGEIFGFVGSMALVGLFSVLLWRLMSITEQQGTVTGRMFGAGILIWIGSHIIINIGAMTGLMPLTGITLPFLSYGGSSLIMMLAALGIAYQLSGSQYKSSSFAGLA